MTRSCFLMSEFEFVHATFCTQSAEKYAARYETFHGCNSAKVCGNGEVRSVASLSTRSAMETSTKPGHAALNLALPNCFLTSCAKSLYQNECNQPLEFDGRIRLGDMEAAVYALCKPPSGSSEIQRPLRRYTK